LPDLLVASDHCVSPGRPSLTCAHDVNCLLHRSYPKRGRLSLKSFRPWPIPLPGTGPTQEGRIHRGLGNEEAMEGLTTMHVARGEPLMVILLRGEAGVHPNLAESLAGDLTQAADD